MKPLPRNAMQLGLLLTCLYWLAACTAAPTKMYSSPAVSQSRLVVASATLSPTFTTTKSPKPSASRTLRPINTPLTTGTPTPTPTLGVSSYRLRLWNEQDSEEWIEKAAQLPRENLSSPPRNVIAFQLEQLLRFPESESWQETAWEVLRTNPQNDHIPGISPGQTVFTWMVEHLLTQQIIAFDDLSTYLENHKVRIVDSQVVKNLFGDGQDAVIFNAEIYYNDRLCGTFGLHKVGELYQVVILREWEVCSFPGAGLYYSIESIGDTNRNGLPEIGVIVQSGQSGDPPTLGESYIWYEWGKVTKTFNSKVFNIFNQTCDEFGDGPCEGEHTFQNQTLTTSEYWYTQTECPDLEVQHVYRWNGKEYALSYEQIVSAPTAPAECRLAWADEAIRFQEDGLHESGWKNNDAINIVAEALKNWSDNNNLWGPAGKDYFQLRLGIWRDLRGENGSAVDLLKSLAAQPSDPKYDYASKIASIYLENRAQQDVFKACFASENAWENAIRSELPEIYSLDDVLDKWGFVNQRWNSQLGIGASVEPLCSFKDGLMTGVKTLQISTTSEIRRWFEDAGVQTLALESGDFNEDGKPDYLAVTVHSPNQWTTERNVWSFVQTSNGIVATQLLISKSPKDEESPLVSLSWKNYRLASIAFPISIVWIDSDLIVFRVDSTGIAQILIRDSNVRFYTQVGEGFSVLGIDGEQNKQIITYTWDKPSGEFHEQIAGYDFAGIEHEVEQLLFVEQNFPAASVHIETFLVEGPPEPHRVSACYENSCTYNPDWYHPYLRYLLGIAYEMIGKPEIAAETYFYLWQDYPNHIFGQAAADKLILRQP